MKSKSDLIASTLHSFKFVNTAVLRVNKIRRDMRPFNLILIDDNAHKLFGSFHEIERNEEGAAPVLGCFLRWRKRGNR